jgi:hypothetical protein
MKEPNDEMLDASPEQVLYANILNKGMLIGLALLLITFVIYAFGIMDPYIPLNNLSQYWSLSVDDYLHQADIKNGWAWVKMLNYGDFLNFIGIAVLSGVTILCYLAIIPSLLRNKDKLYALLAGVEALVLILAASGILTSGAH